MRGWTASWLWAGWLALAAAGCAGTAGDAVDGGSGDAGSDGASADAGDAGDAGGATFVKPPGYASVTFFVDDTANQTYRSGDIHWMGEMRYDPETNVIVYDPAWAGGEGPYPILYDDGPIADGGHERPGASAGDHIFSVEVFVLAETDQETSYHYGLTDEEGNWIWEGPTGEVTIPPGATGRIDAGGYYIHAFGTYELVLGLDTKQLQEDFVPFDPVTQRVFVRGSMNSWVARELKDDGKGLDEAAGDGMYTYRHGENLGVHDGLLYADQHVQFVFSIDQCDYRHGDALVEGVCAWSNCDGPDNWKPAEVILETASRGNARNTAVVVCETPPPPLLASVEPDHGTVLGGTRLELSGEGFHPDAVVSIGGQALDTTFFDATRLSATTVVHSHGRVEVQVTNPDDQAATLPEGFTFVLRATPDLDDGVVETISGNDWHPALEAGANPEGSDWGDNHADRLLVAYDTHHLYLGLVGWVDPQAGNALVVYLDTDFGTGSGVADMSTLSDDHGIDGCPGLDAAISSICTIEVDGFGAELAAGTLGMEGIEPEDTDPQTWALSGLRGLAEPADFSWIPGATVRAAPDAHAVEMALPLDAVLGGPVPAEGAVIALFARLVNHHGELLSNDTLPFDDPDAPEVVRELFVFELR